MLGGLEVLVRVMRAAAPRIIIETKLFPGENNLFLKLSGQPKFLIKFHNHSIPFYSLQRQLYPNRRNPKTFLFSPTHLPLHLLFNLQGRQRLPQPQPSNLKQ
jgi:hypothetical protein